MTPPAGWCDRSMYRNLKSDEHGHDGQTHETNYNRIDGKKREKRFKDEIERVL